MTMSGSGTAWLSVVLLAGASQADMRVEEVASKEVVDLLAGLTLVYDSGLRTAFRMRASTYQRDGECAEGEACAKDEVLVSVATLDEYPDKKAFRLQVVGVFKQLETIHVPESEKGEFRMALRTLPAPRVETCTLYAVTLREMRRLPGTCP